jgi:hypothetical protein
MMAHTDAFVLEVWYTAVSFRASRFTQLQRSLVQVVLTLIQEPNMASSKWLRLMAHTATQMPPMIHVSLRAARNTGATSAHAQAVQSLTTRRAQHKNVRQTTRPGERWRSPAQRTLRCVREAQWACSPPPVCDRAGLAQAVCPLSSLRPVAPSRAENKQTVLV